eukprot:jgi/Galph1/360/GphlegSOOS_G5025.1
MIHFLLALNIRSQVRLYRFYSSVNTTKETINDEQTRVKIPKPIFHTEESNRTDKDAAFSRLLPQQKDLIKSNSASNITEKKGVERAKSWNLTRSSSSRSKLEPSSVDDLLGHSVPVQSVSSVKSTHEDSFNLLGLTDSDTLSNSSSFNLPNKKKLDNDLLRIVGDTPSRQLSSKTNKKYISYLLKTINSEEQTTSEETKVFIDQIYAKVVSKNYEDSPNFTKFYDYKLVFRRYANLYFILGVDMEDDEFAALEWIHLFMEVLDEYFGDATELDLLYNFYKCYIILDEMIAGGYIMETSKEAISSRLEQLSRVEK